MIQERDCSITLDIHGPAMIWIVELAWTRHLRVVVVVDSHNTCQLRLEQKRYGSQSLDVSVSDWFRDGTYMTYSITYIMGE